MRSHKDELQEEVEALRAWIPKLTGLMSLSNQGICSTTECGECPACKLASQILKEVRESTVSPPVPKGSGLVLGEFTPWVPKQRTK